MSRPRELDDPRLPRSLWAATAEPAPQLSSLTEELATDVVVIGGGFTGLSAAVHLGENGGDAILLEAGPVGHGASGRTGGQCIPGLKYDPDQLEEMMGPDLGPRLVEAVGGGPALVFDLVERHGIACDVQREGWIQPAHCASALTTITQRAGQWRARGADVEIIDAAETARLTGAIGYVGGWIDRRGGAVQPLSYVRGLARAAQRLGVRLYEHSPALSLTRRNGSWHVRTPKGAVTARRVIVATNAYSGPELVAGLDRTIVPVYSFQIATKPLPDNVRRTILGDGHVASDTRRLLRYFRVDRDGRLLMGGRGPFKAEPAVADASSLTDAVQQLFPQLERPEVDYVWSGRVGITSDHMPRLHVPEDGLYVAIGYNGRGVALGTLMGRLLAGLATGADVASVPFPVTGVRPLPFHALNRPVLEVMVRYYRWRDRQEDADPTR